MPADVRLELCSSGGGEPTMLGLGAVEGVWAPGGRAVTYGDARDGQFNVWMRDRAGGVPRRLTNFTEGELGWFSWSVDGRQLAVSHGVQSSDVVMMAPK